MFDENSNQSLNQMERRQLLIGDTISLTDHVTSLRMANFSPISNKYAVTCGSDKMLYLYDISDILNPTILISYDFKTSIVTSCSISNDDQKILATREDGLAQIISISTKQLMYTYSKHSTQVWYGSFSPDNLFIVTTGKDQTVRVWDVENQTQLYKLQSHLGNVYSAEFSHDQTKIISAGEDGTVKIWNFSDGTLLTTYTSHTQAVYYAGFSQDDTFFISSSLDTTVKITDVASSAIILDFTSHTSSVLSAKLSYDDLKASSVSIDGVTMVWSVLDGSVLQQYDNHNDKTIMSIGFSYDAAYIISSGDDNQAVITQIGCIFGEYYDNVSLQCEVCNYKCTTCTSFTQCTECVVGYYRSTVTPNCECLDNYFESAYEQKDCKSCKVPCKTCISFNLCQTCAEGYYYNDNSTTNCSVCVSPCKTCSDQSTCLTCISGSHRKGAEDNCICQHGYEKSSSSNDCVKSYTIKNISPYKEETVEETSNTTLFIALGASGGFIFVIIIFIIIKKVRNNKRLKELRVHNEFNMKGQKNKKNVRKLPQKKSKLNNKFFGQDQGIQEAENEDDDEEIIEFQPKNEKEGKKNHQDYSNIQKNTSFKPNQKQLRKKLALLEDPDQQRINSQTRLNQQNKNGQDININGQSQSGIKRIKRVRKNDLIIQEQVQENHRYNQNNYDENEEDLDTLSINSNIMHSTLKSFKNDTIIIKKD